MRLGQELHQKLNRLEQAIKAYREVENAYIDTLNFLPEFTGSSFRDAIPPNKAVAILEGLAPLVVKAGNELREEAKGVIQELA